MIEVSLRFIDLAMTDNIIKFCYYCNDAIYYNNGLHFQLMPCS